MDNYDLLMSIDPSKIKPGDTVRIRYCDSVMLEHGIEPIDLPPTRAYLFASSVVHAGPWAVHNPAVYILEHIPARPDWTDALVVRDKDGKLWLKGGPMPGGDEFYINSAGAELYVTQMQEDYAPITVVLDADGNPPTPESGEEK